jgi:hypothetical protein
VTLANVEVRRALKERFVCAWSDATGDPELGQSFAHDPKETARKLERGNGEHNVQVLFLTPSREVFHAIAGYAAPKDFLDELEHAGRVWGALRVAEGADRKAVVSRMQKIAAADARRRREGHWPGHLDTPTLAREFVAKHPLIPADEYKPSLIFGPGGGVFFGVGKSRHGLLGKPHVPAATTPEPPAPAGDTAYAAFLRRLDSEWRVAYRTESDSSR